MSLLGGRPEEQKRPHPLATAAAPHGSEAGLTPEKAAGLPRFPVPSRSSSPEPVGAEPSSRIRLHVRALETPRALPAGSVRAAARWVERGERSVGGATPGAACPQRKTFFKDSSTQDQDHNVSQRTHTWTCTFLGE